LQRNAQGSFGDGYSYSYQLIVAPMDLYHYIVYEL